ncbi:MAG: polysaccharide deacetylase family protein [Erysipelotrichaceae bacterium]
MKKKIIKFIIIIVTIIIIIPTIYLSIYAINKYNKRNGIPVLAYHEVVEDNEKTKYYKNNIWVMNKTHFEQQMKYLADNDFYPLTMKEYSDWKLNKKELPKNSILITFDDGFKANNLIVKDILKKYNMKASIFVETSSLVDSDNYEAGTLQKLSAKELVNNEWLEFYTHSHAMHFEDKNGTLLETSDTKTIEEDLKKSSEYVDINYFAYPYGKGSKHATEAMNNLNIKLGFNISQNYHSTVENDNFEIPRYAMLSFYNMFIFKYFVN